MQKTVSNGDYSFDAKHDGKYMYCFGNEHWGANSKEVSFNVHGIVYVSEADAPQDPLESEGMSNYSCPFEIEILFLFPPLLTSFPFPSSPVSS